jgi:hypothetical protein
MRARLFLILVLLGLYSSGAVPQPKAAEANSAVFSSPINAACFQVSATVCRLHVDPFTIQIVPGNSLVAFQLRGNNSLLYDFRTDVSNPPLGSYSPSLVKLDFAAACGATYTVNLLARDSGDVNFLNAGQVEGLACPEGTYTINLPLIIRPH